MPREGSGTDAMPLSSDSQVPTELMLLIKHLDWRKLVTLHFQAELGQPCGFPNPRPAAENGLSLPLAGCSTGLWVGKSFYLGLIAL